MEFIDYYRVLGVDSKADDNTIKTAYRKLGRKYHPDVSKLADSAEKFKAVAQAYEVLHSAEKRAEYDALCAARSRDFQSHDQTGHDRQTKGFTTNPQTASNQAFTDFFHTIFGVSGSQYRPQDQQQATDNNIDHPRAADIELEWPIRLADTLADSTSHIEFTLPVEGSLPAQPAVKKALKVKIPAGMRDGERLRLKAQGVPAKGNIAAGDLYLTIRLLPHPWFDLDADNLLLTVPIAPWEAALGTKIMLPTLGGKIQLQIPANSQAGQRLRVKGKGLVRNNTAGDLITMLNIVMPATVNNNCKTLWQQLADCAGFDPRRQWSHLS